MFFRMEHGKGVIPERQDGRLGGGMGFFPSENDAAVPKVQAVEKTQGKMTDVFPSGRGQGIDNGHERRMREISGREIR